MRKNVYFDDLHWWHAPYILLGRILKWKMSVFLIDFNIKNRRFARWVFHHEWVKLECAIQIPLGTNHSDAMMAALHVMDRLSEHAVIKSMTKLYNDGEVIQVYKKQLAQELALVYSMHRFFLQKKVLKNNGSVLYMGNFYTERIKLLQLHGIKINLEVQHATLGCGRWLSVIMSQCFFFALFVWVCVTMLVNCVRHRFKLVVHHFDIAISLASAFQMKFKGARRFDFLIDNKTVRCEETVFLLEASPPFGFVERHQKSGMHFFRVPLFKTIASIISNPPSFERVFPLFLATLRLMFSLLRFGFMMRATQTLLVEYMRWSSVLSYVHFDTYVYSNKEGCNQIAANIIFRQHDIRSVCFSQFVGGPYQVDTATPFDEINVYWAFLNPDVYALNNTAMEESMRKHHHQVRNYEMIGNIFADLILQQDINVIRCNLGVTNQAVEWSSVVAIFDTSYIDMVELYSSYDEYISFLNDMVALADVRSDVCFLFKPSKKDDYFIDPEMLWSSTPKGVKIVELRNKLSACSNVIMFRDNTDPVEVIAASDVVITHAFSSPTADALSAGIPAFWYQAGDAVHGYPFDQVDGLVAHGFNALVDQLNGALCPGYLESLYKQSLFRHLINDSLNTDPLNRLRTLLHDKYWKNNGNTVF